MAARGSISIVDDDCASRQAIADLVRALGFEAWEFAGALDFLASEERMSTGCLIADYWMPGATGVDLHEGLVGQGLTIPTVLVTAYPERVDAAQVRSVGIDWFLRKPVDPDALLLCLRKALAGPG